MSAAASLSSVPRDRRASSPFERTLGVHAEAMPEVFRAQFLRGAATLEGEMDLVWHRPRWIRPLLSLLARRGILFPETGKGIGAVLEIAGEESGHAWRRQFSFREERRFDAVLSDDPLRGIVERMGKLEVYWSIRFEQPDRVSIRTRAATVRFWGRRWRLPAVLVPDVQAREIALGPRVLWVSVQTSLPLVGPFFGYSGSFRLRDEGADAVA